MTAVKELMSRIMRAEEAFANPQNREKSLLESSSVVNWYGICCYKSKSGMNRQRVSDVQAMLNHQIITNRNSTTTLCEITLKLATHSSFRATISSLLFMGKL